MTDTTTPSLVLTNFARINYGFGQALFWGAFTRETVEEEFYTYANQCFGIRKSIAGCDVREFRAEPMPEVFGCKPEEITTLLEHNGDTIAWNAAGEKIRSEFD
jgi:hypothetical protein